MRRLSGARTVSALATALAAVLLSSCAPPAKDAAALRRWPESQKIGSERRAVEITVERDAAGRWIETTRARRGELLARQPALRPPAPTAAEQRLAFEIVQDLAGGTPDPRLGGGFLVTGGPCPADHRCLEIFLSPARDDVPVEVWVVDLDRRQVVSP